MDDSVDFDRDWADFVSGFGEIHGNYWAGLQKMYQLTSAMPHRLEIYVETFTGEPFTMSYESFLIEGSGTNYVYHVSGFSGSSRVKGDALARPNGSPFSTRDRDNDASSIRDCAADMGGGWWHDQCSLMRLNGRYVSTSHDTLATDHSMSIAFIDTVSPSMDYRVVPSFVEMKIQPIGNTRSSE